MGSIHFGQVDTGSEITVNTRALEEYQEGFSFQNALFALSWAGRARHRNAQRLRTRAAAAAAAAGLRPPSASSNVSHVTTAGVMRSPTPPGLGRLDGAHLDLNDLDHWNLFQGFRGSPDGSRERLDDTIVGGLDRSGAQQDGTGGGLDGVPVIASASEFIFEVWDSDLSESFSSFSSLGVSMSASDDDAGSGDDDGSDADASGPHRHRRRKVHVHHHAHPRLAELDIDQDHSAWFVDILDAREGTDAYEDAIGDVAAAFEMSSSFRDHTDMRSRVRGCRGGRVVVLVFFFALFVCYFVCLVVVVAVACGCRRVVFVTTGGDVRPA